MVMAYISVEATSLPYGRGERETWRCSECDRELVVMSYGGRRNNSELNKPCKCLKKFTLKPHHKAMVQKYNLGKTL